MTAKSYIGNPVIDKLPAHLRQFIKPQDYDQYSAIDQAVWRYVMRKNVNYLKDVAHESYLNGLKAAGISTERIPNMYGMNRILKKIGWAAIAVDGFIPPAAFMDFQAYNVLVIASDIRQMEHIEYTPAPDIIHESAGHAPIIANPDYSEFLRHFGEIGAKAISNKKDYELYEAIRHLSIIKEATGTTKKEIKQAEEKIAYLSANMGEPSEMTLLRRLHWWTVEYGLIGTLENPRIYGAGLLSSIGESTWCLTDKVKKMPLTIEAAYQDYDITKPQPQLFVTPDFAHLSQVLEEFTNTLVIRTGGVEGIEKLIGSASLGSIELSTGLQISGVFTRTIEHEGKPIYFSTAGPTSLAYREKELIGHSPDKYKAGFCSPMGKLKGINLAIEDMSPRDLKVYDIYEGHTAHLEFEGGISLSGEVITGMRNLQGKIMLISFRNCTVKYQDEVLFHPDQGVFHMAVGKKVVSAFNGPADLNSFEMDAHVPEETTIHAAKSHKTIELEHLYQQVRDYREGHHKSIHLDEVLNKLKKDHPKDWLLPLELLEASENDLMFREEVETYLDQLKKKLPQKKHLIESGVAIIHPTQLQEK
ncbi:aromatic amino acid hydroxylase [Marinoscillum sp. MHG1-6]|uniref:aromatic amino acid hydroxylase n=1 Tax=Marinoscillum sp. MHG1-6 TaxID=2959627 RepID=UPI0021579979|nr:aromatic amino acid hydroxylase [Marinoscillum sp. MHG1-6]